MTIATLDDLKKEVRSLYQIYVLPLINEGKNFEAGLRMDDLIEIMKDHRILVEEDEIFAKTTVLLANELKKDIPCYLSMLIERFEKYSKPQQP